MQKFFHIGYPKCFSTTLQREFFSIHPQIHYGGIGVGDNNIDFINDEMNLMVESGLIYFRNILYEKEKKRFGSVVANFVDEAESLGKKLAGISSEHLSFSFTPQTIDPDIKLDRLRELFGEDTKIVIVLREQLSLIASLYREYVNMGYQYNFREFLTWLYTYQDRNFYYELFYSKVLEAVFKRFKKENVLILLFEDYKNKQHQNLHPKIFADIADFFKIERVSIKGLNRNPSLTDSEIALRLEANKIYKYDFGGSVLQGIEDHRRRVYFNNYLELGLSEEQLFDNVIKKRLSRAYTISKSSSSGNIFIVEKKIFSVMNEAWKKDNEDLSVLLNRDISTLFDGSFDQVVRSLQFE